MFGVHKGVGGFERIRALEIVIAIPFVMHDSVVSFGALEVCQPLYHRACRYVFLLLLASAGFRVSVAFAFVFFVR